MMARPVADYLAEMGPLADIAPPLALSLAETEIAPIWPEEPEENPQIAIDAAREEGHEGLAVAQADFAAELARGTCKASKPSSSGWQNLRTRRPRACASNSRPVSSGWKSVSPTASRRFRGL